MQSASARVRLGADVDRRAAIARRDGDDPAATVSAMTSAMTRSTISSDNASTRAEQVSCGMGIAIAARERTVVALLDLQQLQHRSALRFQGRLRRALGNTICGGFLLSPLRIGLEAPEWRACDHVGCRKAQRDRWMGEKLGTDDGMPV
jgi:hypothetical protein